MTQHDRMNCAWVEERIDSYLDGDLGSSELAAVEDHLGRCVHCRQEIELAANVLDGLRGLPEVECPANVVDNVLNRARAERSTPSSFVTWWNRVLAGGRLRPALVGAMAVIVIVTSLVAVRLNRTAERFSPQQIEQAEDVLRWTFAYVNDVSRRSGYAVRDEVFASGVVEPVQRAMRSALPDEPEEEDEQKENGGSI